MSLRLGLDLRWPGGAAMARQGFPRQQAGAIPRQRSYNQRGRLGRRETARGGRRSCGAGGRRSGLAAVLRKRLARHNEGLGFALGTAPTFGPAPRFGAAPPFGTASAFGPASAFLAALPRTAVVAGVPRIVARLFLLRSRRLRKRMRFGMGARFIGGFHVGFRRGIRINRVGNGHGRRLGRARRDGGGVRASAGVRRWLRLRPVAKRSRPALPMRRGPALFREPLRG